MLYIKMEYIKYGIQDKIIKQVKLDMLQVKMDILLLLDNPVLIPEYS